MIFADVIVQQGPGPWGLGFGQLAILAVIVCAVVALVYIALRKFGVTIPDWILQALGVVFVCFVIIICIKLVLSM